MNRNNFPMSDSEQAEYMSTWLENANKKKSSFGNMKEIFVVIGGVLLTGVGIASYYSSVEESEFCNCGTNVNFQYV